MNSFVASNSFASLSEQELYSVNGGEFWTGLGLVAAAVVLGAAVVVALPAVAAGSVAVAAAASIGVVGVSFSTAVGVAEMFGVDL
jgi:hypothetical protein